MPDETHSPKPGGMKLGTRLFLLVVLSSLVPAGLVLSAGWLQVGRQMHLWTVPSVESSLEAALQANRVAYDRLRRHLETEGRVLAESGLLPDTPGDTLGLAAVLAEGARQFGIDLAQYYIADDDGFRLLVAYSRHPGRGPEARSLLRTPSPSSPGPSPAMPLRLQDAHGDYLAVPTYLWGVWADAAVAEHLHAHDASVTGALVLGVYMEEGYFDRLAEVSSGLSLYRRLQEMGQVLRTGYGLLAVLVLAISLGFSLWIARRASRSVSRPIDALIHEMDAMGRTGRRPPALVSTADSPIPEIAHLAGAFADLRDTLLAYEDRLREAERVRGAQETARFVAHEIRNTMTPVQASLSMLERQAGGWPPESRERAERALLLIRREADRLGALAGAFSEYARFPERHPATLDLAGLVEELAREEIPDGVRLEIERDTTLPVVSVDREEMERVFRNLIRNAADAMDGRGTLRLTMRSGAGRRSLLIHLEDSGRGMNAETLRKAFQPGFTTKESGTGLGLALVRSALSHYGGTIRIQSEPDQGTRVDIELPAEGPGRPGGPGSGKQVGARDKSEENG